MSLCSPLKSISSTLTRIQSSYSNTSPKHQPLSTAIPLRSRLTITRTKKDPVSEEGVRGQRGFIRAEHLDYAAKGKAAGSRSESRKPSETAVGDPVEEVVVVNKQTAGTKRPLSAISDSDILLEGLGVVAPEGRIIKKATGATKGPSGTISKLSTLPGLFLNQPVEDFITKNTSSAIQRLLSSVSATGSKKLETRELLRYHFIENSIIYNAVAIAIAKGPTGNETISKFLKGFEIPYSTQDSEACRKKQKLDSAIRSNCKLRIVLDLVASGGVSALKDPEKDEEKENKREELKKAWEEDKATRTEQQETREEAHRRYESLWWSRLHAHQTEQWHRWSERFCVNHDEGVEVLY